MVGTIPSLSFSQQLDPASGALLSGGQLYFFQAGTTTPQNAYRDTGLTQAHPNPIILASDGRVPLFYLADGSIHVRLLSSDGRQMFDTDQVLVIGASSGGGGGGTVDPTTIFQTGDVMWSEVQGTRTGWVRDNGRTIGSATSGASERASSDCQALFLYGWAAGWTVVGGAGANAAADWAANKQITLPDKRGCLPAGLDDMGNAAAGRYNGVPVQLGSTTFPGSILGENTHVLAATEMPSHNHGVNDNHQHDATAANDYALNSNSIVAVQVQSGGPTVPSGALVNLGTALTSTTATGSIATQAAGGGVAHNTMPRVILGTFFRKL